MSVLLMDSAERVKSWFTLPAVVVGPGKCRGPHVNGYNLNDFRVLSMDHLYIHCDHIRELTPLPYRLGHPFSLSSISGDISLDRIQVPQSSASALSDQQY